MHNGKATGDGFILDHQTAEVSKLVGTELAIYSQGNTCHVSSDGTINAAVKDDEHNIKLVQISENSEQVHITKT